MRGGFAGVDGVLEAFVDVFPADDDLGVDPVVLEQAGARGAGDAVGAVLDVLDLADLVGRAVEALQPAEQGRRARPVASTSRPQSSIDCRVGCWMS